MKKSKISVVALLLMILLFIPNMSQAKTSILSLFKATTGILSTSGGLLKASNTKSLSTLFANAVTSSSANSSSKVKVASPVTVSPTSIALETNGKTAKLEASSTVTIRTWKSSNEKVVTVEKGVIKTGKVAGEATITVQNVDGKKATCKVTTYSPNVLINQANRNKNVGYASSITDKTSVSYKILNGIGNYKNRMSVDSNTGIVMIDNKYYCSAMGTYFGSVGDKFRVTLYNGKRVKNIYVIMCDEKGDDAEYKKDEKTLAHVLTGYYDYLEFYFRGVDLSKTSVKTKMQKLFEGKIIKIYNETTGKTYM